MKYIKYTTVYSYHKNDYKCEVPGVSKVTIIILKSVKFIQYINGYLSSHQHGSWLVHKVRW